MGFSENPYGFSYSEFAPCPCLYHSSQCPSIGTCMIFLIGISLGDAEKGGGEERLIFENGQ